MFRSKGVSWKPGQSGTPDSDLTLFQLHCRYGTRGGLSLKEAVELWTEMKWKYPDRESHMEALFERLKKEKEYYEKIKKSSSETSRYRE